MTKQKWDYNRAKTWLDEIDTTMRELLDALEAETARAYEAIAYAGARGASGCRI